MTLKVKLLPCVRSCKQIPVPAIRQSGLSLIELMIAMVLGLFIVLGVVTVYVSAARSGNVNEALARVQEAGRFGISFLSRDIRMAGFDANCPAINNLLDETHSAYSDDLFTLGSPVSGWNNSAGDHAAYLSGYVAGTDVISLQSAHQPTGVTATGKTPANANTITVNDASGLPENTILLVADLAGCDLFQKRNSANAKSLTRGAGNKDPGPGNKNPGTNNFSHQYDTDMQILALQSVVYYIGQEQGRSPGLYRVRFNTGVGPGSWAAAEELVPNISNMQIEYGVDTSGDDQPNKFSNAAAVEAAGEWDDVKSVRVWLLAQSEQANILETDQTLVAPFAGVDTSDRRLRYVFSSTNVIRNRMP